MYELIKLRQTDLEVQINQAKSLYAAIEAAGDKATQEDRNKLTELVNSGNVKRKALDQLKDMAANEESATGGATGSRKTYDA